ncbi:basic leucine zipper 23-like [Amaranthus tricolor]|uniref:basic leucine zipper 23-like n=1 Tax=Amaranthus tricolor TaxID=29722 RepID=UPI002589092C|nr:basic leucine zipper 23-like [Amaranthus tricolor]XP_057525909.1 basic leucine zipper 23-like [Amaranthus tricolor]
MEDNNPNNSSNSNRVLLLDDGELEFSNQFSSANIGEIPGCGSMDSFFEELLKDTQTCTHTHTCNPPGPDFSHTHTCFHVHTKILPPPSEEEKSGNNDDSAESEEMKSRKRGRERGGNREAVRKYRLKKKEHAASLEGEVVKLRAINQQLLKRLQGQAALEAEIAKLKCLLVDIRGRIEGEIGSFPYQRPIKSGDMYHNMAGSSFPGSYMMPCNAQCADQLYCLHPGVDGKAVDAGVLNGQGFSGCDYDNCMGGLTSGAKDHLGCGTTNVTTTGASCGNTRRKS